MANMKRFTFQVVVDLPEDVKLRDVELAITDAVEDYVELSDDEDEPDPILSVAHISTLAIDRLRRRSAGRTTDAATATGMYDHDDTN